MATTVLLVVGFLILVAEGVIGSKYEAWIHNRDQQVVARKRKALGYER